MSLQGQCILLHVHLSAFLFRAGLFEVGLRYPGLVGNLNSDMRA